MGISSKGWSWELVPIRESICVFLLCYHAIFAAKSTFVFLPLKNIAPKYFLPLSKCSPEWTAFLFIKLHGLENGSRERHLLHAGFSAGGGWSFSPHCFAGRFSKWNHQLFLKSKERWDCLVGITQYGYRCTTIEDEQIAAPQPLFTSLKCKYRSFWGKMPRARQDKLRGTPWGFSVQEAEGQRQEGLWGQVKERRVTRTEPTGRVTPVPPRLDFFGHFSLQARKRCHRSQATNGNSGDGDKLDVGACGNTNQGNPVGCKGTGTATVRDRV